jgi:hypothetical protein
MSGWAWRAGAGLSAVALLAGLQALILETPIDLIELDSRRKGSHRYQLEELNPGARPRYRLTLYGEFEPSAVGRMHLVHVADAQAPKEIADIDKRGTRKPARQVVIVVPKADDSTYKLVLPGFKPFGLIAGQ